MADQPKKLEPVGDPGPGEETFHEVRFCYYCWHVLVDVEIFGNDGICAYCGHRDATKGVTHRVGCRRWVWEFQPTRWQWICGQRARGHWEYGNQLFQWKDPNPIARAKEEKPNADPANSSSGAEERGGTGSVCSVGDDEPAADNGSSQTDAEAVG